MALVLATPHPDLDIHALFAYYNSIYFDDALSSCFVEWSSPRFTSYLATCNYRKGSCQITLSKPLLQFLSVDHVKNTLLHEMTHAYLFVTKNYRHHGSHGPDFRHIMDSINFSTRADNQRPPFGYKITLFHDFHDEDVMDDNIAYVWMCKKCGNTIKRATATQPSYADCVIQAHHSSKTCGLADCRWHRHKVECGGIYTKIQKPEEHLDKRKAASKERKPFVFRLIGEERGETKAVPEVALVLATQYPDLDIHALFAYYNSIYFDDTLSSCIIEWSSLCLTSCLATCNYRKGSSQITLSKPLLQFLSADHVKNTLLHEMIHAYLFVTKNYRHHGSHGPDFRHIMDSINFSTRADNQRPPFGYKITLFHDFHDEDVMDDNIAYVWMCKKCGNTIKRATATQPSYADCIIQAHHRSKTCGLADCRWHRHKVECGGIYTKIQKPEEYLDKKKAVSKGSIRLLDEESHENVIPEPEKGKSLMILSKEELFPSSAKANLSATSHLITYQRNLRGTTRSKLAAPNLQGAIRLLDEESHESVIREPEKGKSVTTLSKEELFPSSAKANLCATSHFITYRRNLRGTTRSKLAPSGINIKTDLQGQLINQRSPEANMLDKKGKSVTDLNKETMMFLPSLANSHKTSKSRTSNNEVPQAKQGHLSPNAEEPFRTRKLGVQINKTQDSRGHSIRSLKKLSEENTLEKGKSPQKRAIIEAAALHQTGSRTSPDSAKVLPKEKLHQSTSDREVEFKKMKNSSPEMKKASEKSKALEKKVMTEVQTTRKSPRFFPSEDCPHTSSMMVTMNRKPELSSPNVESCRKRKCTSQEYKVVNKWFEYYEDGSADEEIEPLVNRKIIRAKRTKILRELIQREKEEKERKRREETGRNLLCLPGFSQDQIVDISDDSSS